MYRLILPTLLLAVCLSHLNADDTISFSGGYTRAVMIEGREAIVLTQGAEVEAGTISLKAQRIELFGPSSRYLTGSGKVTISDAEHGITIYTNEISYDRETGALVADGWVEVEDIPHELIASAGYMDYNSETSQMKLQVSAIIARNTDEGVMRAKGNTITVDSEQGLITISGDARVSYKDNLYQADITIIDTETNEIEMSGNIRGAIDG